MRMKFKPWARNELETSPFYIDNPTDYKNKWKTVFENSLPLRLELGCGKGKFIANLSHDNQQFNYIAVDLVDAMLGMCKRNVEAVYGIRKSTDAENIDNEIEKQSVVKNLKIIRYDVNRITDVFGEDDIFDRIYINFCNPWPRGKHHKKRLTHEIHLNQYKNFLDGYIYFKTDDDDLFNDSLKYFERADFDIIKKTYDLEKENNFWIDEPNIKTEHEAMFENEGIKTKALIAIKRK